MATTTIRRRTIRVPRDGDTGHLIRGIGYSAECSCGWTSPRCNTARAAMAAGRLHAALHRVPARIGPVIPPPSPPPPAPRHPTRDDAA